MPKKKPSKRVSVKAWGIYRPDGTPVIWHAGVSREVTMRQAAEGLMPAHEYERLESTKARWAWLRERGYRMRKDAVITYTIPGASRVQK